MADMLNRVRGVDDNIILYADIDDVEVFPQDVIHEVLKGGRGIGGALEAHLILEVALPTSEGRLPHILLPDPDLLVSIS